MTASAAATAHQPRKATGSRGGAIALATDLPLTSEQCARIRAVDERIVITGPAGIEPTTAGGTASGHAPDVVWGRDGARFGDVDVPADADVDAVPRAEFALHAMLHFAKQRGTAPMGGLSGRTLLVVGLGEAGSEVARLGGALGMRVLGINRSGRTDDPHVERIRTAVFLGDLLPVSHYVVLALPATGETRGIIGAGAIGHLRSDAVVACIGSGAVLDDAALARALDDERIAGAAFDGHAAAGLPPRSPLHGARRTLMSPHAAHETAESVDLLVQRYLPHLHRYVRAEPLGA